VATASGWARTSVSIPPSSCGASITGTNDLVCDLV
jgi:hypothetical protein